jgi:hypothetical protein
MVLYVDPAASVTSSVTTIASHGVLGAVCIIALYVAWSKDRELKVERDARIADAKGYNDLSLKLQAQVIEAVNKVAGILEEMKNLWEARKS